MRDWISDILKGVMMGKVDEEKLYVCVYVYTPRSCVDVVFTWLDEGNWSVCKSRLSSFLRGCLRAD